MAADLWTAETVRLLLILAFVALGGLYILRRAPLPVPGLFAKDAPMATKIAVLTDENAKLRTEVQRLEYTVDKVLEENRRLRERVDTLTVQVAELTVKMQAAQHLAEEWQQTARDWHSAARAQKEP